MPHKRAKRSVREAEKTKKGHNLAPSAASARDDNHMPRGAMRIFNAMKVQAAFRASGRKSSEDTGERYAERMRIKGAKAAAKEQGNTAPAAAGKRKAEDAENTRKSGGGSEAEPAKKKKKNGGKTELPKIGQHETLGEYNRRVEALMRGGVNAAIKAAEQARGQQLHAAKEAKAERIAIAQGKKKASAANDDSDSDSATFKPNRPEATFAELPQRKRLNDIVQAPPQLPRLRQAKGSDSGTSSAWGATGRTPLSAAQQRILETERERVVGLYREMKAKKEADKEKERERKGK